MVSSLGLLLGLLIKRHGARRHVGKLGIENSWPRLKLSLQAQSDTQIRGHNPGHDRHVLREGFKTLLLIDYHDIVTTANASKRKVSLVVGRGDAVSFVHRSQTHRNAPR